MFFSRKFKKFKDINHCFFSRKGGFSKGVYKGLNCGRGSKITKKIFQKISTLLQKNESKR